MSDKTHIQSQIELGNLSAASGTAVAGVSPVTQRGKFKMTATKSCLAGDEIFTIVEFLSDDECGELIQFSESQGYQSATVGALDVPRYRNNARVAIDDSDLSGWLWERAKAFLPQHSDGRQPVGFNHRIRFYRYDEQQHFDWHGDGIVSDEDGKSSVYTFLVYLNEGFEGGETAFHDDRIFSSGNRFHVTPQTGLALCFLHTICHRSETMRQGRKYVLRTDVMYDL